MGIIRNIIDDNKFSPADIPAFEAKLFYEGAKRRVGLERFAVLMFLSTFIATYGVIGDSTATVIGAMIIAPLMRPIMAATAGLVMGNLKRASFSFLIILAGVVGVIGLSWLITEITVTRVISFELNTQLIGRISPRLLDLYVALAAGAAGAFALSRDDVADSLPGVAMAIALVPPLCVVGIGLAQGEIDAALGAFLLFLTNFLAILLAGGGVLALLGLSTATMKGLTRDARRGAFVLIALGILLVAIPLGATSIRFFEDNLVKRETIQLAREWMQGTSYGIDRVRVAGDQVNLVIYGSGDRPALSELGDRLSASLDEPVDINLVIVPSAYENYVVERED
ncbi:MAG: DUF389 domain-containing protein [Anaerolineales bacterium]